MSDPAGGISLGPLLTSALASVSLQAGDNPLQDLCTHTKSSCSAAFEKPATITTEQLVRARAGTPFSPATVIQGHLLCSLMSPAEL